MVPPAKEKNASHHNKVFLEWLKEYEIYNSWLDVATMNKMYQVWCVGRDIKSLRRRKKPTRGDGHDES